MSAAVGVSERGRTGAGRPFVKMSGSGNDFVFLDARQSGPSDELETDRWIAAACARGTGIGADGAVFLGPPRSRDAALEIRYYNRDGSRASLCGNASLCATRLAVELGIGVADGFAMDTDSGTLRVRMRDGRPEIDLQPVRKVDPAPPIELAPGERRVGFALAGVPHLVVLDDDVEAVDVARRGAELRRHPSLGEPGANVNFVARRADGGWSIRTFERGVEGETLACGTGAVASGILLAAWGLDHSPTVELQTRSGLWLGVTPRRSDDHWRPSLAGEGRIVFQGTLGEL